MYCFVVNVCSVRGKHYKMLYQTELEIIKKFVEMFANNVNIISRGVITSKIIAEMEKVIDFRNSCTIAATCGKKSCTTKYKR